MTIVAGGSDTFTIALDNQLAGTHAGTLELSSPDAEGGEVSLLLAGQVLAGPGEVWVDFAWEGIQSATHSEPFATLAQGANAVATGGTVLIKAGEASEAIKIRKAMRLEAPDGPVSIGRN